MADNDNKPQRARSRAGRPPAELAEGAMLTGHVGARRCCWFAAAGGLRDRRDCTHYDGPLADGLVVGDTDPVPLASRLLRSAHRRSACARPRSIPSPAGGRAARRQGSSCAQEAQPNAAAAARRARGQDRHRRRRRGGICRGRDAAAARLRRGDHDAEQRRAPPVDRPNLSKDYLAGNAPEDWMPLRGDDATRENGVDAEAQGESPRIDAEGR